MPARTELAPRGRATSAQKLSNLRSPRRNGVPEPRCRGRTRVVPAARSAPRVVRGRLGGRSEDTLVAMVPPWQRSRYGERTAKAPGDEGGGGGGPWRRRGNFWPGDGVGRGTDPAGD